MCKIYMHICLMIVTCSNKDFRLSKQKRHHESKNLIRGVGDLYVKIMKSFIIGSDMMGGVIKKSGANCNVCYAFADSRFTVQETAMMNDVKITNCIMVYVVFWVGLLNYFSRF